MENEQGLVRDAARHAELGLGVQEVDRLVPVARVGRRAHQFAHSQRSHQFLVWAHDGGDPPRRSVVLRVSLVY